MSELGQIGYEAYAASTGGKTYDGRDMPTWEQVQERTPHVAKAWSDAASAIFVQHSLNVADELVARARSHTGSAVDLSFGAALALLKDGKRVARVGWNGKAMWIALTPGSEIDPESARVGAARLLASSTASRAPLRILPHIDMKAADGSLVVGWLASQTDMLAEDWMVVS